MAGKDIIMIRQKELKRLYVIHKMKQNEKGTVLLNDYDEALSNQLSALIMPHAIAESEREGGDEEITRQSLYERVRVRDKIHEWLYSHFAI